MEALILSIALEYNLPPYFVLAVAYTENPTLSATIIHQNKDGSYDRGLMQLNSNWFTGIWWDPESNLRIACDHIAWLRSLGLLWWQVAMAYNCGVSRIYKPPNASIDYANNVMSKWQQLEPYNKQANGGY
jgi:soluble lytic murein transglycosylase-like protein